MSISKLIFFPENPDNSVNENLLKTELNAIKFINETAYSDNHYLPGDHFLSLLTFLGCSPNINLAPTDSEDHCYISFIQKSEEIQCLGFTNTVNPKCPNCKKRIANWKTENWNRTGEICQCDKCLTNTLYAKLNWKQEAGFGRCGFEISHIYPHEAVPTDQLLNALQDISDFKWSYCYTNN